MSRAVAGAQIANPADAQASSEAEAGEGSTDEQTPEPARSEHLRSFEMPVVVTAKRSQLRENDAVGDYSQPRWTATRHFTGTRVYVVPAGKLEFEYWMRPTWNKAPGETEVRSLWELEFGLPHRFQIDLYFRTDEEGYGERLLGEQLEVRYALADWGVIPGNPTLYFEYLTLESRPDKIEPKILFGGEIGSRLHWGLNLIMEMELSGEKEFEYSATGGISYAVADSVFAIGVEVVALATDTEFHRFQWLNRENILVGPSFNVHPLPQMTLNVVPLFGVTVNSPWSQSYLNVGWEF